jgi:hypothetical protein
MDDVVEYFKENHNVRVLSRCLSPLELCLIQFHSPIGRQAMVNLSPHHIDEERVISVVELDRGINLRNYPFTRMLTVKIRQPSHEFTFGVGMSFIPYPLVLTPVVQQVHVCMSVLEFNVYAGF